MKKLVLVGLVLLASVMVLVGCKNDSVPEVKVPPKLESISVSPPNKTVYSEGEGFDTTGMVVTASYDDGTKKTVEGIITPASSEITKTKEVDKCITVSYTEGGTETEASFSIDVVDPSSPTKLESYISPNTPDNTWSYVAFGEWPQSEAKNVTPSLVTPQPEGLFKGNYYSDSNGKYVKQGDKYFKVEPIVWRVLTENYNSTGNALLLAEKILTGGIPYYVENHDRKIGSNTVYANNYKYSTIRAWLNGSYVTDDIQEKNYGGSGFLQTAFTQEAQDIIIKAIVDNTARSTNPDSNEKNWKNGENEYASDSTEDKIFLLSEQEATKEKYGFAEYNLKGASRIRSSTDYAKDTGVNKKFSVSYWWLRSPISDYGAGVRVISRDGYAGSDTGAYASYTDGGVVPALCVSASAISKN